MKKRRAKLSWLKVNKFQYNGIYADVKEELTSYKAKPLRWTGDDPGVCFAKCNDGKERRIPLPAFEGFKFDGKILGKGFKPTHPLNGGIFHIGPTCKS